MSLLLLSTLSGAFGLASAGCSDGLTIVTDCYDYSTFKVSSTTVSFQGAVLPIFRTSCGLSSACHGTNPPPAPGQHYYGPALSAPDPGPDDINAILAGSVGVMSVDEPDMQVIDPGHPETSFMMYKLDGDPQDATSVDCSKLTCVATQSCGSAMPQTGTTLPSATRDTIRQWIAQGAKNN